MKEVLLDPEDEHLRNRLFKWGNYLPDGSYVVALWHKGKNVSLARFLLDAVTGVEVDHINRNRLDNRKENLRLCSKSQNCCNRAVRKDSTTGYKGVWFNSKTQKYKVEIGIEGKKKALGYFTQLRAAVLAYNTAALKYHGEFAFVNDVPSI